MRGQLDNQYEGVGQSEIKAKFGSVRIQALQEEFATFVGDLMQLKAEVIARHFSPQTIAKQSALAMTPDAEMIPQAVALIKNFDEFKLRVTVKPESLAMLDYAQLKNERTAYLNGLSQFLQSAAPMIEQDKRSLPFLLEMLKWAMAGFKGSAEVEGIMDKAIDMLSKAPPEPDAPTPEETRSKMQLELEQMRQQGKERETQMKGQLEMQIREHDQQADIATEQAKMQFAQQLEQFKAQMQTQIMAAKLQADVQTELMTSQINAQQNQAGIDGEIQKKLIEQMGKMQQLIFSKGADVEIKGMEKGADMQMAREALANQDKSEG